jgi:GntR family transcriptional regulator, vanillate catabolism transcriptional regulator
MTADAGLPVERDGALPPGNPPQAGATLTQAGRALLELREMIVRGDLAPGERLVESALVDRLRASRTPVREALGRLAAEGLIEAGTGGGYVVKAFGERDVVDAIEIRGALEGLAARVAAERGVVPERLADMEGLLAEIDRVVAPATIRIEEFARYADLNGRFHDMLVSAAESPAISRQIEIAIALPFASPSGLLMAQASVPASRALLVVAQDQHRCLIEAIVAREGARAEAIAREHARLAIRNMRVALRDPAVRSLVPGAALVRGAGDAA